MTEKKLLKFLEFHRLEKESDKKPTHLGLGFNNVMGKFLIDDDDDDIDEFYELYAKAYNKKIISSIAEKQKETGKVLIDVDLEILKENYSEGTRLYNDDMIEIIIETYRNVMKEYLILENKHYLASVFEKPKPTIKDKTIKDGFHIVFHNIHVHYYLRHIFRFKVIQLLNDNQIFRGFLKPLDDIIDKAVVYSNAWLLPGSKKKDGYVYELTKIYTNEFDYVDLTEIVNNGENMLKLFGLYTLKSETKFKSSITFDNIQKEYEKLNNKKVNVKYSTEVIINDLTDFDFDVARKIDENNFINYSEWFKTLYIFKSIGFSFDFFDELSQLHSPTNYNKSKNFYTWNSTKKANSMNKSVLYKILKRENYEEFKQLMKNHNISFQKEQEEKLINNNIIHINERFLLNSSDKLILDGSTEFEKHVLDFHNNDYKTLNIKSPYGTGKTQFIKAYLTTFKPKKVLWISYRKTLTHNLMYNFGKDFNFVNYLDVKGNLSNIDFLIVQLESLLRIQPNFIDELPSYDLIILDEIESILNQFTSPTMKKQDKLIFTFLEGIIFNSEKVISLDGDFHNRALSFVSYFGKDKTIFNDAQFNLKKFKIVNEESTFFTNILDDLKNGLKVYVCSQYSSKATKLSEFIKSSLEEEEMKIVQLYTGKTDDNIKTSHFEDVNETWKFVDLLIYSPTVEAGVDFSIKHFDKCYGIIGSNANTQRSFLQMLSRVRNVNNENIQLLDASTVKCHNDDYDFYKFDEMKEILYYLNDQPNKNIEIVNGKAKFVASNYENNYLYNKVEELNKNSHYYINYLTVLLGNKGHSIDFEYQKPKFELKTINQLILAQEDSMIGVKVYLARDIDNDEYEKLLQRQTNNICTGKEKYKIEKHIIKLKFGVDYFPKVCHSLENLKEYNKILTHNVENPNNEKLLPCINPQFKEMNKIVKDFNISSFNKFLYLMDTNNNTSIDSMEITEENFKVQTIKKLITDLGFKHMFDNSTELTKDTFDQKLKNIQENNFIYTNKKQIYQLFNFSKSEKFEEEKKSKKNEDEDKKENSNKKAMGYINKLLGCYNLKVNYNRKRINSKQLTGIYTLGLLNQHFLYFIEAKLRKGCVIFDSDNIRPIIKRRELEITKLFDMKKFTHKPIKGDNNKINYELEKVINNKDINNVYMSDEEQ